MWRMRVPGPCWWSQQLGEKTVHMPWSFGPDGLPDGSVSESLRPGWKGSAKTFPTHCSVLKRQQIAANHLLSGSNDSLQSVYVLGDGSSVTKEVRMDFVMVFGRLNLLVYLSTTVVIVDIWLWCCLRTEFRETERETCWQFWNKEYGSNFQDQAVKVTNAKSKTTFLLCFINGRHTVELYIWIILYKFPTKLAWRGNPPNNLK